VADVNTALGAASLSTKILATRDGDKVVLKGLAGVTSFALTAETGSPRDLADRVPRVADGGKRPTASFQAMRRSN